MTTVLVIRGAATGLAVALAVAAAGRLAHTRTIPLGVDSIAFAGVGIAVGFARGMMHRPRIAALVEARAPQCRNLLFTANELIEQRTPAHPYVTGLVYRDAARVVAGLDIGGLFPIRNAAVVMAAIAAIWAVATNPNLPAIASVRSTGAEVAGVAAIRSVDLRITNPAYIGGAVQLLHDPQRIGVVAGSQVEVTVRADANAVTLTDIAGTKALHRSGPQTFTGEILTTADGFLALQPATGDGAPGLRRLIGVTAFADQPPTVRISLPGRDLRFPDGRHAIDLAIEADDDNALASLRLRYTRISGSGERFTFTDGDVPLVITRPDRHNWKAHATWRLDSLALGPGDMVVYRAVATDFRPNAPAAESESYFFEVLAPGGIAAGGFATDPDVERYALSEQMVILKTEQLSARKMAMTVDSFAAAAAEIAAEQRRVRAEFVFMMGGEVGGADDAAGDLNEAVEASGEGDLAVQRMLNQGRAALLGAIRSMSRAATALTSPDVPLALTQERDALAHIEKTFAHSRIILRALSERERLDPTRRLSGALTDAARNQRALSEPVADTGSAALRELLLGISSVVAAADSGRGVAARASALGERMLRQNPSSAPTQQVASQLDSAATALGSGRVAAALALLDRAATGTMTMLRASLIAAPRAGRSLEGAASAGAHADAMRHPAGHP